MEHAGEDETGTCAGFYSKKKGLSQLQNQFTEKKSYDIALKEMRPKILAMKRQLQEKYQQLEKEYYQLNKSLAKKNLSPTLTYQIKLCNKYML